MPVKSSRTRRYNSEYKSHYKKFSSKRPDTVKGEITRSVLPYEQQSHVSTPRAGLQSIQLGVIHEPPLQRKKIVPYEKNHNIFPTGTTKELSEREWLQTENTSREYETQKHFKNSKQPKYETKERQESPLLVAEKKMLKSAPAKVIGYNYVSDGVKRRSTYTQDFAVKGRKSTDKTVREHSPIRKPKPAIGGTKSGISPDRLPAAGVRTMTSLGDKRLLKPSDNSQYMKSLDREDKRVYDSEYSSRFKFVNGTWIESPEYQGRQPPYHPSKERMDWFKEVINRRNEAYGYAHNARGTHFARDELDRQNRLNAHQLSNEDNQSMSAASEYSSISSKKKDKSHKQYNKNKEKRREAPDRPPIKREAWSKRPPSSLESSSSFSTAYTDATETENGQFILERGRSPTPELRETGQSRRHHYDMTTNILNEKLEKSLTFSPNQKQKTVKQNSLPEGGKASLSESLKSQNHGSYAPPERNIKRKDDGVMSERSMTSRASTASETLERARNRRDFWSNQRKKLDFED